MKSATNCLSPNLNWNGDDFKHGSEQASSSFCLRNDDRSGYRGMLQAPNSFVPSSPNIMSQGLLQDASNFSQAFLRESQAVRFPNGQVDLTYLSQLPGCSPESQAEKIMNQSSNSFPNTRDVDSLSNTFLQLDLMRNVRKQLQLQEEHILTSKEGKSLQQQALLKEETLRRSKDALQLPEDLVRSFGSIQFEMEEWQDFQDQQDLQQQAVSKELELRWYKHKVWQLRSRVKALLHEQFSMGKQIKSLNEILSKQGSSDQNFPSRTSTSSIPSIFMQNTVKVDGHQKLASHSISNRDFKITKSQIDPETQDMAYQDMYYTDLTISGWQSTQGSRTKQICSNSGIPHGKESFLTGQTDIRFQPLNPQASVSQSSRTPNLLPCTAAADVKFKNLNLASDSMLSAHDPGFKPMAMGDHSQPVVINFPTYLNGKSITSERNKTVYYDSCDVSSSSSVSNQDLSPSSLSPVGPHRQYWGDTENLTASLPKCISHQGQIKTELCKNWQEYGNCHYSIHCRFAHGAGELRPVFRHPLYKTQICRMLMEGKKCIYNHRCHFRHSLTDEEISLIARLRECLT